MATNVSWSAESVVAIIHGGVNRIVANLHIFAKGTGNDMDEWERELDINSHELANEMATDGDQWVIKISYQYK